jgi:hypothetical protein
MLICAYVACAFEVCRWWCAFGMRCRREGGSVRAKPDTRRGTQKAERRCRHGVTVSVKRGSFSASYYKCYGWSTTTGFFDGVKEITIEA